MICFVIIPALNGWVADDNGQTPWVEIDLIENKLIGGVVTWPRGDGYKTHQYVKTFNIQYQAEGEAGFKYYMESGNIVVSIALLHLHGLLTLYLQTFVGNENVEDVVLNGFPKKIIARHVRLNVLTYFNRPTMRLEILGCEKRELSPFNLSKGLTMCTFSCATLCEQ
ncbi:hypothetical protein CAPTEDRAFT_109988 [Capitella teleta]|uniref:F5/8 type C domain-containing protein n=1 Tax=Capitella teleta TaxID=283909 RepID=R7V509_CAPTE|nr:hypothetical protein CAPTEDRAFT_109988 [Capitella teleta]|eukprot:ELU10865.1 hypothetical protein CAPTEDRAFT_109988 [Capitella teleta]